MSSYFTKRVDGVMVIVLASTAVDGMLESRSGKIKDNDICIYINVCFSILETVAHWNIILTWKTKVQKTAIQTDQIIDQAVTMVILECAQN